MYCNLAVLILLIFITTCELFLSSSCLSSSSFLYDFVCVEGGWGVYYVLCNSSRGGSAGSTSARMKELYFFLEITFTSCIYSKNVMYFVPRGL